MNPRKLITNISWIWPEIEPRSLVQLSAAVTIMLECFLCLCEAVIESMGDSV